MHCSSVSLLMLVGCATSLAPQPHPGKPASVTDAGTTQKLDAAPAPAMSDAQVMTNRIPPSMRSAPSTTPSIPTPDDAVAAETATSTLQLSDAQPLGAIRVLRNRSSVRLYLPGISGARDYRVFAVRDGVSTKLNGTREHVEGADITCAGQRQRNQCTDDAILPLKYNTDELDLPKCEVDGLDRRPNIPTELRQVVEVNGLSANTTLVVEAIDQLCPFPGLYGSTHLDSKIVATDIGGPMVDAVVNGRSYSLQRWMPTFPVRTEAEIRAQYGSMIFNGQGWNEPTLDPASPSFPESPYIRLAQPAPANDPVVLARSVIKVSPTGNDGLPNGFTDQDYFDDFDDASDQPKLLRDKDYTGTFSSLPVKAYQTKKWILFDVANGVSDFMVDRGRLQMVHGDTAQGSMTTQAMYPKRPVRLPTDPDRYLHVTYEVQRNETPRRYENLSLCGSDKAGETYDGEAPKAAPLPRPGFMNDEHTAATSPLGWNCLMLVARGAGYGVLPGGDVKSHADTSLKITVVATHPAPADISVYDHTDLAQYAKSYGPTHETQFPRLYERQIDANKQISGPWLDDVMDVWQRARFDVFIRRDRVVIYVEGQQRICQELPGSPITMAEGALGFWHVLYHSSAEFLETRAAGLTGDNPRTAQMHILHNTPFADMRTYDNVGFREDVALPANFDAKRCYTE